MKKLFAAILILNFFSLNVFAIEDVFEDSLVKNLSKDLKIEQVKKQEIKDDFIDRTLDKNLKIQKQVPVVYQDNAIKELAQTHIYITGNKEQKFDFESLDEQVVKVSPKKYYTTRTNLEEGDLINFVLVQDVTIKNKTYKKGTPVIARVETVSKNGAYGVPSDLVIDNFILNSNVKLTGSIEKKGANRSLWVYPCAYGLSWFFGLGLLFLPIRGGHAKLKPNHTYELTFVE